ncbi:MAG: hypothetical protein JXL80_17090 [Planctomycetes bacterium]|nr:hypothetical protein [Planctomycetota bacterium]
MELSEADVRSVARSRVQMVCLVLMALMLSECAVIAALRQEIATDASVLGSGPQDVLGGLIVVGFSWLFAGWVWASIRIWDCTLPRGERWRPLRAIFAGFGRIGAVVSLIGLVLVHVAFLVVYGLVILVMATS